MKRVHCLYRVSTKGQVDKDDIPMQKQACHEFTENQSEWRITKEYFEKGVSGFKVSADNRDEIQELKAAAERKEFDILLVFMFDRLGRIESETPVVVQWFVNAGIEVWSVKEGQLKIESHSDKLMNYIRFWMANGESIKTSERVKTRIQQLTAEGMYTGGVTPFGYRLIKSGKIGKKGKELKDLEIDETEAPIVQLIFNKTVKEGYGSCRMAEYLNKLKIKTHSGSDFQCNTVNRILKNRMYCGYYISNNMEAPYIGHLHIIDEKIFDEAQKILNQRSSKKVEKQNLARTTKGKTMLSGNVYCGHCGGKLNAASYTDSYTLKDGTVCKTRKQRYLCANKAMKRKPCDGQVGYVATKIDEVVTKIITDYLSRIKTTPKSIALERKYKQQISESQLNRTVLKKEQESLLHQLSELTKEVSKSLIGDSKFTPEILSSAIEDIKEKLRVVDESIIQLNYRLENEQGAAKKLDFYYEQFQSWSDEFESASNEQKKMIACNLIQSIKVSRGYELEIELNVNYEQFFTEEIKKDLQTAI